MKTSRNSTNWEQYVGNLFQMQIGPHILITGHWFLLNIWLTAGFRQGSIFRTDVLEKYLSSLDLLFIRMHHSV